MFVAVARCPSVFFKQAINISFKRDWNWGAIRKDKRERDFDQATPRELADAAQILSEPRQFPLCNSFASLQPAAARISLDILSM